MNIMFDFEKRVFNLVKKILKYKDKFPKIKDSVFLADGVMIIGDVNIEDQSNIWYNTVIRADVNYIRIGKKCNIQDGLLFMFHPMVFQPKEKRKPTIISDNVTIGHNATIHACEIGKNALWYGFSNFRSIKNRRFCIYCSRSIVPPGSKVGTRELWAGNPARFVRKISDTEERLLINTPDVYYNLSQEFLKK